ncbi:MAG: hypothetical protein JHD02_04355 [Thermoleophilaceae bacterium]|nr:hypothetical protein [Thermoleophilaceae bacterium]
MNRNSALSVGILAIALATILISAPTTDLSAVDDRGLISVLPLMCILALAAFPVAFYFALKTEQTWLLLANVLALIIVLYGLPYYISHVMQLEVSWRHVGIADELNQSGMVDTGIDAYFNWPGFFAFATLLSEGAGRANAIFAAQWAPIAYNLLYLPALWAISRVLTDDRRVSWVMVWVFFATNWYGQDYFSPQATGFFLYLVTMVIVLRRFSVAAAGTWLDRAFNRLADSFARLVRAPQAANVQPSFDSGDELRPRQRIVLVLVAATICIAVAVSHQLTPFMLLGALVAATVARRNGLPGLSLILFVAIVSWLSYGALSYVYYNAQSLLGPLAEINSNVNSGVSGRVSGSPEHLQIVYARLLFNLSLWIAACGALIWRLRNGHRDWLPFGLMIAPIPAILVQPYGGEMVIRAGLFSSPWAAFFVALLLVGLLDAAPRRGGFGRFALDSAVPVVTVLLILVFILTRWGNARIDYFSSQEVAAVEKLYEVAPPNSTLIAGSFPVPWRYTRYAGYRYGRLANPRLNPYKISVIPYGESRPLDLGNAERSGLISQIAYRLRPRDGLPTYLILSRSQTAYLNMFSPWESGTLDDVRDLLEASPRFKVVYTNSDAVLLTMNLENAQNRRLLEIGCRRAPAEEKEDACKF